MSRLVIRRVRVKSSPAEIGRTRSHHRRDQVQCLGDRHRRQLAGRRAAAARPAPAAASRAPITATYGTLRSAACRIRAPSDRLGATSARSPASTRARANARGRVVLVGADRQHDELHRRVPGRERARRAPRSGARRAVPCCRPGCGAPSPAAAARRRRRRRTGRTGPAGRSRPARWRGSAPGRRRRVSARRSSVRRTRPRPAPPRTRRRPARSASRSSCLGALPASAASPTYLPPVAAQRQPERRRPHAQRRRAPAAISAQHAADLVDDLVRRRRRCARR